MNILLRPLLVVLLPSLAWAQLGTNVVQTYGTGGAFQESQPTESRSEETDDIVHLVRQALNERFENIKHNDLRDVMKHDKNLPGTSRHILIDIANDPAKYAGTDVGFYLEADGGITPEGPVGNVTRNSSGKAIYKVSNHREERRKDAILSVTYEKVWDVTGEDKVFDIDLLLFIHSSQRGGYYFRKINIETTWKEKVLVPTTLGTSEIAKTTVKNVINEVPLSDTDFDLHVELATQKAILYDKNYGLTRVFPITAGALDVRTNQIDNNNVINSMTLLLPGREGNYSDFNLADSVMIKRSKWQHHANQASRIEPSYYKGRPFIGIVDRSRLNDPNNYGQGYRGIGFHYQIDDSGLQRGFESHGCMRLQDHDLYTLDAILNQGPKDMMAIEVKMFLDQYHDLDSVYKRKGDYKKVVYAAQPNPPRTVRCENMPSYPVRFFENGYHTLADSDCLTQIAAANSSLEDAVDYLIGVSSYQPSPLIWNNAQHAPIRKLLEEVKSDKYSHVLSHTINQTFPGTNKWVGDLDQSELEALLANLQANASNDYYYNDGYGNSNYGNNGYDNNNNNSGGGLFGNWGWGRNNNPQPARIEVWPNLTCSTSAHRNTLQNLNGYASHCQGKAQSPTSNTPRQLIPRINNCAAFYNALVQSNCRQY